MSSLDLAQLLHAQPVQCRLWGADSCRGCEGNAAAVIAAGWVHPADEEDELDALIEKWRP